MTARRFSEVRRITDRLEREQEEAAAPVNRLEDIAIHDSGLPGPMCEHLYDAGHRTVADLSSASDADLLQIDEFGPGALAQIRLRYEELVDELADRM